MATRLRGVFNFLRGFRMQDGDSLVGLADALCGAQSGVKALAGGGAIGAPIAGTGATASITGVTAGDSVQLPPAQAGDQIAIRNTGPISLNVFASPAGNPNNGGALDLVVQHGAVAASPQGTALPHPSGAMALYICFDDGIWVQGLLT